MLYKGKSLSCTKRSIGIHNVFVVFVTTKSGDFAELWIGRLRRAVAELRRAGPGFVATRSGDLAELGLRRAGRKNMVNPINSNLFFFHLHL